MHYIKRFVCPVLYLYTDYRNTTVIYIHNKCIYFLKTRVKLVHLTKGTWKLIKKKQLSKIAVKVKVNT